MRNNKAEDGGLCGVGAALVGLAVLGWASAAEAAPPRDYFLDAPAPGTYAHLDAYTVGAQASLENRADLEPGMSMLHTRVSGIVSYPYADGSLNLDARVFLFTFGASAGYRYVYLNHTFEPGEERTRDVRNETEDAGETDTQTFNWHEGRARLVIPLDMFFMINTGTIRWEGRENNSFDWFHANVHDEGTLGKYEATFFFRHRDFGAIGPYFRFMDLPRDGGRETELHYGLVFGTRPGFVKPRMGNTDLFLLQAVFNFGKDFKGDDEYGLHAYGLPWYFLAVYRVTLGLDRGYPEPRKVPSAAPAAAAGAADL